MDRKIHDGIYLKLNMAKPDAAEDLAEFIEDNIDHAFEEWKADRLDSAYDAVAEISVRTYDVFKDDKESFSEPVQKVITEWEDKVLLNALKIISNRWKENKIWNK